LGYEQLGVPGLLLNGYGRWYGRVNYSFDVDGDRKDAWVMSETIRKKRCWNCKYVVIRPEGNFCSYHQFTQIEATFKGCEKWEYWLKHDSR